MRSYIKKSDMVDKTTHKRCSEMDAKFGSKVCYLSCWWPWESGNLPELQSPLVRGEVATICLIGPLRDGQ